MPRKTDKGRLRRPELRMCRNSTTAFLEPCGKLTMSRRLGGGCLKLKSHQAMHAVKSTAEWWNKTMQADIGSLTVADKVQWVQAVHEDLAHLGGRDAAVTAIKQAGTSWPNMALDAAWILRRCKHCLGSTTKGTIRQLYKLQLSFRFRSTAAHRGFWYYVYRYISMYIDTC